MRSQQTVYVSKNFRTGLATSIVASFVALAIILPALPAHAATSGLDTPSGVLTLPLSVNGQQAISLNADTTGATPPVPTVVFSGPINQGPIFNADQSAVAGYATTIATDGMLTTTALANLDGGITVNQRWYPAQALSINSNQIWKSATAGDSTLYLQYSVNGGAVEIGGAANATNNLLVSNGSIGINTTNPQATLDVNGLILINAAGVITEGAACSTTGLIGRDSTGALLDCMSNGQGANTWSRPQTFSRVNTTVGAVDNACSAGGDPYPPGYNELEYRTTCASRFCQSTINYGFGMLIEAATTNYYNPVQPYASDPNEALVIACSR